MVSFEANEDEVLSLYILVVNGDAADDRLGLFSTFEVPRDTFGVRFFVLLVDFFAAGVNLGDDPCLGDGGGATELIVSFLTCESFVLGVEIGGTVDIELFNLLGTGGDCPFGETEILPVFRLVLLVSLLTPPSPRIFNNLSVTGAPFVTEDVGQAVAVAVELIVVVVKDGAAGAVVIVALFLLLLLLLFLDPTGLCLAGEVVKEEFDNDNPANKSSSAPDIRIE